MITFTNLTPYAGEKATEVGWYVLGEDQQQVGPYAFSELRGELFASLSDTIIFFSYYFNIYISNEQSGNKGLVLHIF